MKRIVVGVDGSEAADAALRWAVAEAGRHGADLVALLAWNYLDQHHGEHGNKDQPFDPAYGEDDAREKLRAAVERVGATGAVEQRVVCDLTTRALLEAGAEADLLVVGTRGHGGFAGLLLGSVSERVLEHAHGPVTLVRTEDRGPADRPVVVGVDGSDTGARALHWAAEEARARRAPLQVVHAWQPPYGDTISTEEIVETIQGGAQQVLDEALADPALDGLQVEGHLPSEGATRAMLALAPDASMVVVGSRGVGRFGRVLLGSTSRQLAHHSPCPITVVPPPAHAA